jgi:hypothetical protein
MTDRQILLLLGTIWIAPHCPPIVGNFCGVLFILAGVCKGLGWL